MIILFLTWKAFEPVWIEEIIILKWIKTKQCLDVINSEGKDFRWHMQTFCSYLLFASFAGEVWTFLLNRGSGSKTTTHVDKKQFMIYIYFSIY